MAKIGMWTKFVLFVTILVLSTISAKPASNENSSSSEEVEKKIVDIVKDCRSEFKLDETVSEDVKPEDIKVDGCYLRCIFDKLGVMKNNTIDEKEVSKSLDMFVALDSKNEEDNKKADEIFTNCATTTNSKNLEDKCEPLKLFAECIDKELKEFRKTKTSE